MLSAVEGGTTLSFVDPHGDRTKRSVLPLCSDGRCLDFPSSTEHITSLSFAPISSEINFIALLETKENGLRMLVKVSSHGEVGPLAGYATDLTTQVLEYTDVAYSAANRTLFILCQPCGAIYEADLEGRILAVDWESLPKLAAAGLNPLKLGISEDGGRVAVFTRPAGHGGSGQLSAHLQCAEASEIQIRALSPPSKAWPVALMDRSKSCCYFGTICLPDNCRILLNQGWTVDLEEPPEPEGDFGVWPLNLMDENGTCCVMEVSYCCPCWCHPTPLAFQAVVAAEVRLTQDQCSPWHCDFLISRGWEVPLYRARHPAVEPVASLDMQRCPSQQLKTPADVRGGASGMALDEPRKKIWVVYNEGNGGFRHWLVQYAYDGTPIRTVAIFGPQNPTGEWHRACPPPPSCK